MKKRTICLLLALLLTGCTAPPEPVPTTTPTETTAVTLPPQTLPAGTEPEAPVNEVPRYFQTDYPYIRYGNGTMASSGCSLTCLAMAASWMTGEEYTPDMLAWTFGGYGENNIQRLNHAIAEMQLPCEPNHDWRLTKQALREGAIAILLVDERSEFTTSAHFILLTGINEEGRYVIHDPFKPNYSEDYLEEGFEKGFTEGQILAGLEGSWVFRKENMGAFRCELETPPYIDTRYEGFCPTPKDIDYLARFVWAAAREEDARTQQAVAELVLNRMVADKYPDRVEDVMGQEELYVWYQQLSNAQLEAGHYEAVTNALYGPNILPRGVVHGAPWPVGGGEEWGKLGSFTFWFEKF